MMMEMMFESPMGMPLGHYRKPSRVETAKRFLRAVKHTRAMVHGAPFWWELESSYAAAGQASRVQLDREKDRAAVRAASSNLRLG
uniref:Uncharacterized protein n=1 Tax=Knipowitschia caucasica TaxID=637954 RepID=A0AAV2L653_KNICA